MNSIPCFSKLAKAVLLFLCLPLLSHLYAQEDTELKMRLMTEALQARDNGSYDLARAKLEELLVLTPEDASVKRILSSVERQLDEKQRAPTAEEQEEIRLNALRSEAEYLAKLESKRIEQTMDAARNMRDVAERQANRGEFQAALGTVSRAIASLDPNPMTQVLIEELQRDEREYLRLQSEYNAGTSPASPDMISMHEASPGYVKLQERIEVLALRGRSQYFAGDLDGAEESFRQVETMDPNNANAKSFLIRIARDRQSMAHLGKEKTRQQLLEEVANAWQRPNVYEEQPDVVKVDKQVTPLAEKLNQIVIPSVNFTEVELIKVINTLSAISEEFDDTKLGPKGVNLVLLDPERKNPLVNITLRNLSLKRILDFISDSVGYQYEIQSDAVVLRPGGELTNLNTEVFPVARSTVIRMTGGGGRSEYGRSGGDPFASGGDDSQGNSLSRDAVSIQGFLQQAGVDFTGVDGSTLAYDGSAMIVTQSTRNLERIRNILNRYTEVKQVEIEAKFLEVQEGTLEELGFDWLATKASGETFQSSLRTLAQAGSPTSASSAIIVDDKVIDQIAAPNLPGENLLGEGTLPFTNVIGSIGDVSLDVTIRALSQKSGTDLLSAPKVTVLSGNEAHINVSQEFRYPTRYSDTESDVGSTRGGDAGSAGVTITPGTPQDFETRNVGVELKVTPIVEEDDYSITLDLNPRVTEFEGFVEYGGPSIAISSSKVVKTPSGFYQPIFSVREVSTKVTIWDGATVVMGGMTREDVITVKDKVPFFGDIPFLGRFFRSEGESSAKRNLLIFVTANLVSPGGSPKRQSLRGVQPGALFQNPNVVTPGGSESRSQ